MSEKNANAKAEDKQVEAAKEEKKAVQQVRTVHGSMVDMSTGEAYDTAPKDCDKLTSWMQMQVEAGKMEIL